MKKFNKNSIIVSTVIFFALGLANPIATFAAGPAIVNLGTAGNFVILTKTGISTTGVTSIIGDLGISPAAASYITGFGLTLPAASAFSTSALVTGKIYAPGYANPTPANLTTAVLDMETAYTDATGRAPNVTELGAGNIGGLTLAPGVYKWGTGVIIPTDVTLSGGANDVWIFQIAQNLTVSSASHIILSGGAQVDNIFWIVAGQTTLGTTSVFNGNILGQTAIVLNTGAQLNGRALAQTAVTLDSNNIVIMPTPATQTISTASSLENTSVASTNGTQIVLATSAIPANPAATPSSNSSASVTITTPVTPSPPSIQSLQNRVNELVITLRSLQAQAKQQNSSSAFGQQVRTIAINLKKGSKDKAVQILQKFLISQNKGPDAKALAKAGETEYFGDLTQRALAEFQAKIGISPALGNFGAITRAYINSK